MPSPAFSDPGGKNIRLVEGHSPKGSIEIFKAMKLELKLERILDKYFNFEQQ